MQKKLYFGSNLKMYKNIQDTVAYLQKLVENTKDISRDEIELFIIPSYTTLESATRNVLGRPGTVYRGNFSSYVKRAWS